jgi:hypothetical protein
VLHIPSTRNGSKVPATVGHGGGGGRRRRRRKRRRAGCKGLMYNWLTALFIAAAAAPTEVKEILYTQRQYYKLTSTIMARNHNIWIRSMKYVEHAEVTHGAP